MRPTKGYRTGRKRARDRKKKGRGRGGEWRLLGDKMEVYVTRRGVEKRGRRPEKLQRAKSTPQVSSDAVQQRGKGQSRKATVS